MKPSDLINTAEHLLKIGNGRPRQSDLQRSVSTIYYALFHSLARCCADSLIGTTKAAQNSQAWLQVYRHLSHTYARTQCKSSKIFDEFPQGVQEFACLFVSMQVKRNIADYDPLHVPVRAAIQNDLASARAAIAALDRASPMARTAFSAWVLLKVRDS